MYKININVFHAKLVTIKIKKHTKGLLHQNKMSL